MNWNEGLRGETLSARRHVCCRPVLTIEDVILGGTEYVPVPMPMWNLAHRDPSLPIGMTRVERRRSIPALSAPARQKNPSHVSIVGTFSQPVSCDETPLPHPEDASQVREGKIGQKTNSELLNDEHSAHRRSVNWNKSDYEGSKYT